MDDLDTIFDRLSTLSDEQLSDFLEKLHAVVRERTLSKPKCYFIRSQNKHEPHDVRYLTLIAGRGWRQCAAVDLNHSDLRLFCSEKAANLFVEALSESNTEREFSVISVDKLVAAKWPCATMKENRYQWLRDYVEKHNDTT